MENFNKDQFITDCRKLMESAGAFKELVEQFEDNYDDLTEEIEELSQVDGELALVISEMDEFFEGSFFDD